LRWIGFVVAGPLMLGPGKTTPTRTRWGFERPRWSNPKLRAALYQAVLVVAVACLCFTAFLDVRTNMEARGIPTGFGFLDQSAGFDINQSLVAYSATSTYGRAFLVGLLNTCLVAAISLVLATIVGFLVGILRLSPNLLVRGLASAYVEMLRNVPLVLQLLFWYNAVLRPLPPPREALQLPLGGVLTNRGLYLPAPVAEPGFAPLALAGLLGIGMALALRSSARSFERPDQRRSILHALAGVALVLPPCLAVAAFGAPLRFEIPELQRFNFVGGLRLTPELVALVLGLSLYTAAFVAEIVRAGLAAVPIGQSEAAAALGLGRAQAYRFVLIPQAMRIIVPLLTSQYLNLIKNSSLAVFIGYPDLVQVFAGTVLNQTGAAVQVILVTMAVYLAISLVASLAMNLYNRRVALVER
jgi:general L-amino acid transport system permease protein